MPIQRVSLFKLADEANVPRMLALYDTLAKTNSRNDKPYILSVLGRANLCPVERSRGYNFVAITRFATLDDLRFYDEECQAHKTLKTEGYDLVQKPFEPPLTIWVEEPDV